MPDLTLAYPWRDAKGKAHKADATVSVDRPTATALISAGLARPAAPAKSTAAKADTPQD